MSPNCQDYDAPNIPFLNRFMYYILDMYEVTTISRDKKSGQL